VEKKKAVRNKSGRVKVRVGSVILEHDRDRCWLPWKKPGSAFPCRAVQAPVFRSAYKAILIIQNEWIEYTIEKPNSRLQKYRLTLAGERAWKAVRGGGQMTPRSRRVLGSSFSCSSRAGGCRRLSAFAKTHLERFCLQAGLAHHFGQARSNKRSTG
jgi:hypothetical protein